MVFGTAMLQEPALVRISENSASQRTSKVLPELAWLSISCSHLRPKRVSKNELEADITYEGLHG